MPVREGVEVAVMITPDRFATIRRARLGYAWECLTAPFMMVYLTHSLNNDRGD
jgi:hypothetical protein